MPNEPPPEAHRGKARRFTLESGVRLTRIHDRRFGATAFNPRLADPHWGGGRFDASELDPYGFLYAAEDDPSAVAEALLRHLPLSSTGSRLLPHAALRGRQISWIAPAADLELVSLRSGADLAAVSQDAWLTKCDAKDYGFTRRWAQRIREWAPWAQGFVWRSRREEARYAYVFFEDRCPEEFEEVIDPFYAPPERNRLDREPGGSYVLQLLAEYNVTVFR